MRSTKAKAHILTHSKRGYILALDGSEHQYTIGSDKSRKQAVLDAQDAGEAHLSVLAHQKGEPLTANEKRTGRFDEATLTPPRSMRKEQAEQSPRNPYEVAAASIADQYAGTPGERAIRDNRAQHMAALAAKHAARQEEIEANSSYWNSDDARSIVTHATAKLEEVQRSISSTPGKINEARRLYKLATTQKLDKQTYFDLVAKAGLSEQLPTAGKKVGIAGDVVGKLRDGGFNIPGTETPAQ